MSSVRGLVVAGLVAFALVLQVSLFPHLAWRGVGPDLVLLVVVGAALVGDERTGMITGFAAGLLLDLAPPADHVAGRWALALLLVGLLVGRFSRDLTDGAPGLGGTVAIAGAASFVGASVFALTGLLLRDPAVDFWPVLEAVLVSLVWDLALAAVVVPGTVWLLRRLEPERAFA